MNKLQLKFYTNNSEKFLNELENEDNFSLSGNSPKKGRYLGFNNAFTTKIYISAKKADILQSPMKEEISFEIEGDFAEEAILAYVELQKFLSTQKTFLYMG